MEIISHIDAQFDAIIREFKISGNILTIKPYGRGHINDTYLLTNSAAELPDYLLQRINHQVFGNVSGMMSNIHRVTEHLKSKFIKNDSSQITLELIKTKDHQLFKRDTNGCYWRIFDFKKGMKSYDVVETPEQAYNGAYAFGSFLYFMADFDPVSLIETIPKFHSVIVRMQQLKTAESHAFKERKDRSAIILKEIDKMSPLMCEIETLKNQMKIPLRVTHNDTKFNNVLLEDQGRGLCVIDLDTVMPGIVHYDFGDGIRTSTNLASEDENDLNRVKFDIEKFNAFVQGYLDGVNGILTPLEIEYLARSGALLSFIMGVRFLTDYLNEDVYYKISYEGQNFNRGSCQIELARQIIKREAELKHFIRKEAALKKRKY
ncbi:MAG: aminoglycoside phosphotransferase family protein [Ekhidna sp.]|nr:aminoglycoside phosphotransferase family protein [Ekhidna sp.]